jgi:hypothetical protein
VVVAVVDHHSRLEKDNSLTLVTKVFTKLSPHCMQSEVSCTRLDQSNTEVCEAVLKCVVEAGAVTCFLFD